MDKNIEKIKNLLIDLDLKYKATKDELGPEGFDMLYNFEDRYNKFGILDALDVLNKIETKFLETETALKLACDEGMKVYCSEYCTDFNASSEYCRKCKQKMNYSPKKFKTEAKEIIRNGKR